MIRIDHQMLVDLGLGDLPPRHEVVLLRVFYHELEMRVGQELANAMSDAQLDEFEVYIDAKDQPGALAWLEREVPYYKDVVRRHVDLLRMEVRASGVEVRAVHRAHFGPEPLQAAAPADELPGWSD